MDRHLTARRERPGDNLGRAFQAGGTAVPMPGGREGLGPRSRLEPAWLEWSEQGQRGGG